MDAEERSVLAKFRRPAVSDASVAESDSIDEISFATARGQTSPVMLDIRLKTGDAIALPYAYLTSVEYDASGTIRLQFVAHCVTVSGRNLRRVYDGLIQHRVRYMQEESSLYDESPETGTFIEAIAVQKTEELEST